MTSNPGEIDSMGRQRAELSYHTMRLAHAKQALLAGLRRWGAWLGAAVMVAALVSGAPLATVQGIAAASALPLWQAATGLALDPLCGLCWVRMLVTIAAIGLLAQLPLMAACHWWWPTQWALAEQALPLRAADIRLSDFRLQGWFTMPVCSVPIAGVMVLARHAPPATTNSTFAWAVAGLLANLAVASALAWVGIQAMRRHATRRLRSASLSTETRRVQVAQLRPRHWSRALLALPLRRGMGRGSAALLLGGFTVTPLLATGPLLSELAQGVGLMLLALLGLPLSALLQQRLRLMIAPWRLALGSLPIRPQALDRAVLALSLAPVALGLVTAAATLAWTQARLPWSLAYLMAVGIGPWIELRSRPDTPAAELSARWLFTFIAGSAMAWETIPR